MAMAAFENLWSVRSIRNCAASTILSAESKDKNLRDFEPFTNPLTAAKIIVGRLKALPYRYRLTVQLPVEISEPLMTFVAAVKLSETAVICAANRLPENFETSSKDSRIDGDPFQTFLAKV